MITNSPARMDRSYPMACGRNDYASHFTYNATKSEPTLRPQTQELARRLVLAEAKVAKFSRRCDTALGVARPMTRPSKPPPFPWGSDLPPRKSSTPDPRNCYARPLFQVYNKQEDLAAVAEDTFPEAPQDTQLSQRKKKKQQQRELVQQQRAGWDRQVDRRLHSQSSMRGYGSQQKEAPIPIIPHPGPQPGLQTMAETRLSSPLSACSPRSGVPVDGLARQQLLLQDCGPSRHLRVKTPYTHAVQDIRRYENRVPKTKRHQINMKHWADHVNTTWSTEQAGYKAGPPQTFKVGAKHAWELCGPQG